MTKTTFIDFIMLIRFIAAKGIDKLYKKTT